MVCTQCAQYSSHFDVYHSFTVPPGITDISNCTNLQKVHFCSISEILTPWPLRLCVCVCKRVQNTWQDWFWLDFYCWCIDRSEIWPSPVVHVEVDVYNNLKGKGERGFCYADWLMWVLACILMRCSHRRHVVSHVATSLPFMESSHRSKRMAAVPPRHLFAFCPLLAHTCC